MGEELERLLKVVFLIVWNHLNPETKQIVLVLVSVLGLLSLALIFMQYFGSIKLAVSLQIGASRNFFASLLARIKLQNPIAIPAASLLMLAAVGHWPYNFYVLTRLVVCLSSIYLAGMLQMKRFMLLATVCVLLAILFNPVAPFHFPRNTWRIFNVLGVLVLVPTVFIDLRLARFGQPSLVHPGLENKLVDTERRSIDVLSKNPKYRYCSDCRVRVGLSDLSCKRCGSPIG